MLTLGEVRRAEIYAKQGVSFADRSWNDLTKVSSRATLADALHQSGRLVEAEKLFLESETIQKRVQPEFPFLYSLQCYKFCDLLMGIGNYREVMARIGQTLEGEKKYGSLLSKALVKLSLGRAWMMRALEKKKNKKDGSTDFNKAKDYLDLAANGLRKAGTQDHLPRALLARAAFYRIQEEFSQAW